MGNHSNNLHKDTATSLDVVSVIDIIWRFRLLITTFIVAGAIVGLLAFIIKSTNPVVALEFEILGEKNGKPVVTPQSLLPMIKSNAALQYVSQKVPTDIKNAASIIKSVDVEYDKNSVLVGLSVETRNTELAQQVLNAVPEFLNRNINRFELETMYLELESLNASIAVLKENLSHTRRLYTDSLKTLEKQLSLQNNAAASSLIQNDEASKTAGKTGVGKKNDDVSSLYEMFMYSIIHDQARQSIGLTEDYRELLYQYEVKLLDETLKRTTLQQEIEQKESPLLVLSDAVVSENINTLQKVILPVASILFFTSLGLLTAFVLEWRAWRRRGSGT